MCDHIMHLNLITYHLTVRQKNFPEDWCGSINPIPNTSLLFLSMYLPIYLSITHHDVVNLVHNVGGRGRGRYHVYLNRVIGKGYYISTYNEQYMDRTW